MFRAPVKMHMSRNASCMTNILVTESMPLKIYYG